MKRLLFTCLLFSLAGAVYATHNRAGEITYQCLDGLTNKYKITVTTYTKIQSPADRCELMVYFGDGDSAYAPRVNNVSNLRCNAPEGDGDDITATIRKNIYETTHIYPGAGQYRITMYDPNRNSGIINIANSVNTPFYLESWLMINPLLGTCNNSPTLANPPIDNGCLYKCFYHNPGAFDIDGDSLSYELGLCLGYGGQPVQSFSDPTYPSNVVVNPVTGDLIWCTPQPAINSNTFPQQYNFAMYIKEYRKLNNQWYLIGFVERDLQVDIDNCTNNPPVIADVHDTCVLAGDTLNFPVFAYDPDSQFVTLSASGGPMLSSFFSPPATFTDTGGLTPVDGQNHVTGIFSWATNCNMVRSQPYQVVFKAVDNDPQNQLIDIETVFIKIIAPPPRNLTATPQCDEMHLSWTVPVCNPSPDYITGYRIYRLDSCDGWVHSYCETGVPGYTGYVLIGSVTGVNTTTFIDDNGGAGLSHGVRYAYHVVAVLADGAESYASNKVCEELVRDVPVMTNVDVTSTSSTTGTIDVKWASPLAGAGNLDTIAHPGPYLYRIYRRANAYANANQWVATLSAPNFAGVNGISSITSYTDNALNTDADPYVYNVQMLAQGGADSLCRAKEASSVFLTLTPNDNRIGLSWQFNVPWTNYKYHIYRSIPSLAVPFTLIDSTTSTTYTDSNLANGRQYCYKIKAYGQYQDTSIIRPLINWSEEKCAVPVDLTPPCCPVLSIVSDCNNNMNTLSWTNPNASCTDGTDDVVAYNVYFTPVEGEDMNLLATVNGAGNTFYVNDSLESIAGCYQVLAVDSFNNQSANCNMVCVDNCPIYDLPNVFTPNGDGLNDLFIPFPYKYVKDIDLHIYNRWGQIVFSTTDPDVNWDGTDQTSKQLLSDGVYFYVCIVHEIRLKGIESRPLKGFVQLLQHKQ